MDWTPLIHALIAMLTQALVGLVLGNWWLGGALACSWWLAREHTQAEYRYIAAFAGGHRDGMPWWGGFYWRCWDWPSLLDAAAPAVACLVFYLTASKAVFLFSEREGFMEPTTSTGAAGMAGWKLIGGLAGLGAIGAGLAAVVVMCITTPRDPKEWAVGLISTVMASVAGGSAVVQYMGIQHWANSHFGLIALLGLCFTCGLPGWAVVRWTFNAIRKRDGKGIDEIAQEVRDGLR